MEIVGPIDPTVRGHLERFAAAATAHPWGGSVEEARLVVATNRGSLKQSMRAALREWLPPADFAQWEEQQVGRPVTTGGKTFVARDGVVTAVVMPAVDPVMLLGVASHELLECAHLVEAVRQGHVHPTEVREVHGMVLADEYVTDRARTEIVAPLDWPESDLDRRVGLVPQTDDVEAVLDRPPYDGPPSHEFWAHWVNLARVWAMAAGRADGGAAGIGDELREWEGHRLIDAGGWQRIRAALDELYRSPGRPRQAFVEQAAGRVWDPVEALGREAWASS